jgi:hypothetical protein
MSSSTRTALTALQQPKVPPKISRALLELLCEIGEETQKLLGKKHLTNINARKVKPKKLQKMFILSEDAAANLPSGFIAAKGKFMRVKAQLTHEEQVVLDNSIITLPAVLGINNKKFADVCFPKLPPTGANNSNRAAYYPSEPRPDLDKPCVLTSQIYLWQFLITHGIDAQQVPQFLLRIADLMLLEIKPLSPDEQQCLPKPDIAKHKVIKLYGDSPVISSNYRIFSLVLEKRNQASTSCDKTSTKRVRFSSRHPG